MNPNFKQWLLDDSANWNPDYLQSFLQMLKFNPDQALQLISKNLWDWGTSFMVQSGATELLHVYGENSEILEAYQAHFAEELALVTQQFLP